MVSRLKFDIGNEIDRQFSYIPTYIWESDSTTFCDLNMAGGQFIQRVGEWLRKYGHSDDNIRKRVFGFSEKPLYLSYIKSNPSLIGTFDIYNDNITMKFDVQLGNDPYQETVKNGNKKSIWNKLAEKRLSLLNEGGFLALIHPSGWRNFDGDFKHLQNLLNNREILYLEMHDIKEGIKLFGAETDYDLYVVRNKLNKTNLTKVYTKKGIVEVDLNDLEFIPNDKFDEFKKIIAKPNEEKVTIISNSSYHTSREYISEEKTDIFKYPCINTVGKDGEYIRYFYSSINNKGHFGQTKVIFSMGRSGSSIVDKKGEYGVTQFAFAIVDDIENLDNIKKAIESPKFIELMKYADSITAQRYNRKIMSTFRKDFWKEFI